MSLKSKSPRRIKIEAHHKCIPGFKRIQIQACPGCDHFTTDMIVWFCKKHDLIFGPVALATGGGISAAMELICDDHKCDIPTIDMVLTEEEKS